MATLKLKTPAAQKRAEARPGRTPVRGIGAGVSKRPTQAQAQAEREAQREFQRNAPPPSRQRSAEPPPPARPARAPAPRGSIQHSAPAGPQRGPNPGWHDERRPAPQRGEAPRTPPARPSPRPDAPAPSFDPPRRAGAGSGYAPGYGSGRAPAPGRAPQTPGPSHGPQGTGRPPKVDRARFKPVVQRQDDDDDDDDAPQRPEIPGSLRLSKRMSELGMASRREADEWIAKGWVRVDDRVVSELGSRVLPEQRITIDARAKFQQAQRVTVVINKPIGYVSGQAEDGYEPAVVLVTPDKQWREDQSGTRFLREHLRSLVPAGRLDIDSVGLLVLTQDGRIAKQLIGEDSDIEKEYLVRVASESGEPLSQENLQRLRHGLELDGEPLREAVVEWVNDDQLRFVLKQGKKRQIRRMCEAVGLRVTGLKRVRIGSVMLGDLPTGEWRYLRADESFG